MDLFTKTSLDAIAYLILSTAYHSFFEDCDIPCELCECTRIALSPLSEPLNLISENGEGVDATLEEFKTLLVQELTEGEYLHPTARAYSHYKNLTDDQLDKLFLGTILNCFGKEYLSKAACLFFENCVADARQSINGYHN